MAFKPELRLGLIVAYMLRLRLVVLVAFRKLLLPVRLALVHTGSTLAGSRPASGSTKVTSMHAYKFICFYHHPIESDDTSSSRRADSRTFRPPVTQKQKTDLII